MKKVSVIIPCYNQGKYIQDAIESVLAQTYNNVEIICINDCSDDNSLEIITNYSKKYKNILVINNKENKGVIFSRNFAIQSSGGEYILPLDADDVIEKTYIEKAVKILDENSKIGIVYCKAKLFGTKEELWNLKKFNKSDILYDNCIFATALFRKSDFIKAGMYKEYMKKGHEDHDLWLSFIEHGLDVYQIDEVLFKYRQYEETSRTKTCVNNVNEIYKNLIKNHLDLYLNDNQFFDRLLFGKSTIAQKKIKKYKKKFKLLLFVIIIETVAFILTILYSTGLIVLN